MEAKATTDFIFQCNQRHISIHVSKQSSFRILRTDNLVSSSSSGFTLVIFISRVHLFAANDTRTMGVSLSLYHYTITTAPSTIYYNVIPHLNVIMKNSLIPFCICHRLLSIARFFAQPVVLINF